MNCISEQPPSSSSSLQHVSSTCTRIHSFVLTQAQAATRAATREIDSSVFASETVSRCINTASFLTSGPDKMMHRSSWLFECVRVRGPGEPLPVEAQKVCGKTSGAREMEKLWWMDRRVDLRGILLEYSSSQNVTLEINRRLPQCGWLNMHV